MEIKLKKPIEHGGQKIEAVTLNLDGLTGSDVIFCEREAVMAAGGVPIVMRETDGGFQLQMAAKASGLSVATLGVLGAPDALAVLGAVRNFLLVSD